MKVVLDDKYQSYINIDFNKDKNAAEFTIKTNKDSSTAIMLTISLSERQLDKIITALISMKPEFMKSLE